MFIPPSEDKDYEMPDDNFTATMNEILNREIYTYYLLDRNTRMSIRHGFRLGFDFARIGYLSRGIK